MIELNRTENYLDELEASLRSEITRRSLQTPLMIGIHRGGVWLAERLHQRLGLKEPLGRIDISFYRDDFSRAGLHPAVQASSLESGMVYWDGSEIDSVVVGAKTVRFVLAGNVKRTVRAGSMIALAHNQVAVAL